MDKLQITVGRANPTLSLETRRIIVLDEDIRTIAPRKPELLERDGGFDMI